MENEIYKLLSNILEELKKLNQSQELNANLLRKIDEENKRINKESTNFRAHLDDIICRRIATEEIVDRVRSRTLIELEVKHPKEIYDMARGGIVADMIIKPAREVIKEKNVKK